MVRNIYNMGKIVILFILQYFAHYLTWNTRIYKQNKHDRIDFYNTCEYKFCKNYWYLQACEHKFFHFHGIEAKCSANGAPLAI